MSQVRTPSAETTTPVESVEATARLRWLGLEPYGEEHRRLYYGREEDADELRRRVRSSRSTLLLGKMGSGKTSLLRASFLPEQREKGCLPVYVRLDFSKGAPRLGTQVKQAIHAAATREGLHGPDPAEGESLWEYLHLDAGEFWTEDYQIVLPMIVLDQFEEILTLGQSAHRVEDSEAFVAEITDLIEGRVPAELRVRVLDDPAEKPRYAPKRHHYKIIVSLRDEALAELDRHRRVLPPDLLHNRCRLTPIDGAEAMSVVTKAGAGIVADEVAEAIVRKVAGDEDEGTPLEALEVEPAILSVFCRWLDDKRATKRMDKITMALLEAFGDRILLDFYDDSLVALPGRRFRWWPTFFVHHFVEHRLISDGDVRTPADAPGTGWTGGLWMGDRQAKKLTERHVLRSETHDGKHQVNLSHDVLIEPVRQSGRRRRRAMLLRLLILLPVAGGLGYVGGSRGQADDQEPSGPSPAEDLVSVLQAQDLMATELNRATELIRSAVYTMRDSEDAGAVETRLDEADSLLWGEAFATCPPLEDGDTVEQEGGDAQEVRVMTLTCNNRAPLFTQIRSAQTRTEEGEIDVEGFSQAANEFDNTRDTINDLISELLRGAG